MLLLLPLLLPLFFDASDAVVVGVATAPPIAIVISVVMQELKVEWRVHKIRLFYRDRQGYDDAHLWPQGIEVGALHFLL